MLIPSRDRVEPDSYTRRREAIASQATGIGAAPAEIDYLDEEHATWSDAMTLLDPIWERNAALPLRSARHALQLPGDHIPQLSSVSERLEDLTGFTYASVPAIVSRAEFFGALSRAIFPSTQFIRWAGNPLYTPAPDIMHEVSGHAISLANEHLAELHRLLGRAGAATNSPALLREIAHVFWYTAEFGVVRSRSGWKAYGAGLLSSPGELSWFAGHAEIRPLSIAEMIATPYDISRYQPVLFGVDSLEQVVDIAGRFCSDIADRSDPWHEERLVDLPDGTAERSLGRSVSR